MTYKILIIDDTYDDIRIIGHVLEQSNMDIAVARSGATGIRVAQYAKPDLILLDVMLNDQIGFEVCEQLRSEHHTSSIPIIFVSSLDDADLKRRAFQAGAQDYITKPFHETEIRARIEYQLQLTHINEQIKHLTRVTERQYMAREVHDTVMQEIFAMRNLVKSMLISDEELPETIKQHLQYLDMLVATLDANLQIILHELRPSHMQMTPLSILLQQLITSYQIRVKAPISLSADDAEVSEDIKFAVYRITQEALNNIAKHARANNVHISVSQSQNVGRLVIVDDGRGFDYKAVGQKAFKTILERAEENNIEVLIESSPGNGTQVEVIWEIS